MINIIYIQNIIFFFCAITNYILELKVMTYIIIILWLDIIIRERNGVLYYVVHTENFLYYFTVDHARVLKYKGNGLSLNYKHSRP
jgi:hypothetical protein